MTEIERSAGTLMNRRVAMGALVAGAGALVFGPAGTAQAEEESAAGHWVSWDDGWEYPLVGIDESGQWIVAFDDDEHLVDPFGWISDGATWYAISAVGTDGIWYIGNDGFEYLLDGFDSSIEFVV
jgi:hypothetical protein